MNRAILIVITQEPPQAPPEGEGMLITEQTQEQNPHVEGATATVTNTWTINQP
jgi:hypothetical protein